MGKLTKLGFVLILSIGMLLSPITTFAQNEKKDYLALGDSLAAGQTPDKQLGKGYADYIASQLNKVDMLASFDKRFAVPGYTTTNILTDIQNNIEKPDSTGYKMAIQTAIQNAEIITLDVGANDFLKLVNRETLEVDQTQIASTLQTVGTNILSILTQIKTLNPNAHIYIMGYYNPFSVLPDQYKAQFELLLGSLNTVISNAVIASQAQATFVPAATSFAENGIAFLPNPLDIHPNQAGYLSLANEFWKALDVGKVTNFSDTTSVAGKIEIDELAAKGIISGYTTEVFKPKENITRKQSAIMLNRAIVYSDEVAPNPNYVDVSVTSPGYDVIAKMTQQGVFAGTNQHFNPDKTLTRGQMAIVLVKAFHLTGTSPHTFTDVSDANSANSYVSILAQNQITVGYGDGTFKPNEPITRAEFSIMLAKALNK